ncbi:MAG: 50S ribosomal protein L19 [Kiritimatiellae bacterium]|jgi:large subunit ribosomal protein L19|nr:50S ribosomal protein L19 [Kiritimatiellia bacterium]
MIAKAIDMINAEQVAKACEGKEAPEFKIGDSVKVYVKIKEGDKERVQAFIGTVIARDGGGNDATFTVRRITFGVGVEKVFPLYSPYIDKIEVERSARVRRAKLYYLRKLTGKKARLREAHRAPKKSSK